jgi:hypothetical protein
LRRKAGALLLTRRSGTLRRAGWDSKTCRISPLPSNGSTVFRLLPTKNNKKWYLCPDFQLFFYFCILFLQHELSRVFSRFPTDTVY